MFNWDLKEIERWYAAGPRELAAFVGEGPLLSDDRPLPEYFLSMPDSPPKDVQTLRGDFSDVLRP